MPFEAVLNCSPNGGAFRVGCRIRLEHYDIGRPACRSRYPIRLVEIEGLRQESTSDHEIASVNGIGSAIPCNPPSHLSQRRGSVGLSKRFSSKRTWDCGRIGEHTASHDEVQWRMQLEKE